MTTVKNHKDYFIGDKHYFVEQYAHSGMSVFLWRYGYYYADKVAILLGNSLKSRPNLKRLFGN